MGLKSHLRGVCVFVIFAMFGDLRFETGDWTLVQYTSWKFGILLKIKKLIENIWD
jgi:uncharacterized protein (DUF486 family)